MLMHDHLWLFLGPNVVDIGINAYELWELFDAAPTLLSYKTFICFGCWGMPSYTYVTYVLTICFYKYDTSILVISY